MAVLDPNEIMFRAFEPKVQNRFIMYMDNIPSFMVKTVSAPSFEDGEVVLIISTLTVRLEGRELGTIWI